MVFPLPSFPWQEAQFCAHVVLASAAAPTPADAITIAARTDIFRFIELWLSPMGSNFDDSEVRSKTDLFLERSHVGNERFNLVIAQFATECFHRGFAVLLNAVFDCRGRLRIRECCLLLRIC